MRRQLIALGMLCGLLPGFVVHTHAAEAPAVSAASAVLMDAETGRVLYAHNEQEPRAIASTTKLMTALVAAEYLGGDLSETVEIKREWTGIEGTSLYLKPGETITLKTLLYGLLLHSGNDAAVALAGICGGEVETFVGWMNQRAQDLGMTNTHFSDPNGLGDENHYASALDMAKLGVACLQNPTVAEILSTRTITLEGRQLTNHNKLLWQYEGCTGMKTGYTRQAGRTLVSSAERNGQTLVCVTLNDRDDWNDHKALLDYGFSTFPRQVLAEEGEERRRVPYREACSTWPQWKPGRRWPIPSRKGRRSPWRWTCRTRRRRRWCRGRSPVLSGFWWAAARWGRPIWSGRAAPAGMW